MKEKVIWSRKIQSKPVLRSEQKKKKRRDGDETNRKRVKKIR